MSVDNTLAERGSRYGDFSDHALIAQELQNVMRTPLDDDSRGWPALSAVQKQALTVIADKIARILSGDPNYADNWHDIQGYAKLAEDRLPKPGPLPGTVVQHGRRCAMFNGGLCDCGAIVWSAAG